MTVTSRAGGIYRATGEFGRFPELDPDEFTWSPKIENNKFQLQRTLAVAPTSGTSTPGTRR